MKDIKEKSKHKYRYNTMFSILICTVFYYEKETLGIVFAISLL